MNDNQFDPRNLLEAYRTAVAPVLKSYERIGRFNFAVAGDYFDYTLAQAKVGFESQSPSEYLSKQSTLLTSFGDKLRSRGQEFYALAAEAQTSANQAFKDATSEVAELAKSKRAA